MQPVAGKLNHNSAVKIERQSVLKRLMTRNESGNGFM